MKTFKIKTAILIFLTIPLFSISQISYNLSNKNLNGKVKIYEEKSYTTKMVNGKYEKHLRVESWTKDEKIWFDENGNYSKLQRINSDGTVYQEFIYEYDENQKLSLIKIFQNEQLTEKKEFIYDERGILINEKWSISDELYYEIIYNYNDLNFLSEKMIFEDNELIEKIQYKYNDEGLLVVVTDNKFEFNEKTEKKYLYEDKILKEIEEIDSKNKIITKEKFEYSISGNISEKTITGSQGELKEKYTYIYNENNILTEKNIERGVFTAIFYKYEYDKNNNCTQILEYKGDKLIYIYEYNIEYYE